MPATSTTITGADCPDEIRALRAQVAALQADEARLDWLLDNAISIVMMRAQELQTQDRAGIDAARSGRNSWRASPLPMITA